MKYSKAGQAWTKADEVMLCRMHKAGYSLKDMCGDLERTSAGIIARLEKQGIITREEAEYMDTVHWSVVPLDVPDILNQLTCGSAFSLPDATYIKCKSVGPNRQEFYEFQEFVRRLGTEGCLKGIRIPPGWFFNWDRYISLSDVFYQLSQVEGRGVLWRAHYLVITPKYVPTAPQQQVCDMFKTYWKKNKVRPFHWYAVQNRYPDGSHIHVIVEGWNWDFQSIYFSKEDLSALEDLSQSFFLTN